METQIQNTNAFGNSNLIIFDSNIHFYAINTLY